MIGRKSRACPRLRQEIGKYQWITETSGNPEALETGKVLLNAGEDFVQWNLAAIVERRCL